MSMGSGLLYAFYAQPDVARDPGYPGSRRPTADVSLQPTLKDLTCAGAAESLRKISTR